MLSLKALDALERCGRSSFFDTVGADALAHILRWASCLCSFTDGNQVHPLELMFDAKWPFLPLMCKIYSRLMIAVGYHDEDVVQDGSEETFVISPLLAQRFDVIKCR